MATQNPKPGQAAELRDHLSHLLARVGAGDRSALKSVYDLTHAKLFGVCLRILNDDALAEDALQDSYIKVWRSADRFDAGRASPITWLAAIARNTAIDRRRALGTREYVSDDILADAPSNETDALTRLEEGEKADALRKCLGTLEEKQRNVIRTAFFEGDSYRELAERMGTPLGTVKSWVRRGLKRLKDCMEDE